MSESDYVEPSSESFWEIGQYKRTVKRAEDGHKLCSDIVQMISERADLEKAYSKSLKAWSKKWSDYLNKGNEYGSMKSGWQASLVEADKLSEIHLSTHNALNDELNREIKDWQKHNYQKTLVGQLKITKEYEEEFKKAQKPWSKKYFLVEKTKKEYHGACKSYQSAKIHLQNSQADPQISPEQRKKLEDKVEKYKKEVEVAKNKYKQALDDLNSYNSRYIEDMNNVYKKCDQFEKERLEFFIQQLLKLHTHLNIFDKMNIEQIYAEFMGTIKQTSPDKDLHTWSKECGAGMAMSWPVFEEYSDQVKQIAKSSKKSDEGVTMTSIKQIDDTDTRSLSISANDNNHRSISSIIQKTSADRDDVILTERHKDLVESLNIELKEIRKNRVGEIKSISKSRESSCSSFKSESVYSLNQYKEDKSLKRSVAYETESFSSDSDSKGSNKTLNTQSKKVNFGMTETLERTKASGVIRSMSGKISKHLGTLKQRLSEDKKNHNENHMSIRKSDIKIVRKNSALNGSCASSIDSQSRKFRHLDYPIEQNPFGVEDGNGKGSAHSKSSFAPIRNKKSSKSEYENFSQNKKDIDLYDNLNPQFNLNNYQQNYDNLPNGPLSSHSRESNPFGEYDEDDDSHKTGITNSQHHAITSHESDDDERAMYLNVKVKALYDYHSAEDDELSFKAGEEFIKLANEDERGWCLGEIGERVGLYPATYAVEF